MKRVFFLILLVKRAKLLTRCWSSGCLATAYAIEKLLLKNFRNNGGHEQKMLGFLQVLEPIKWQDLLEEGENGLGTFRTGAKIHFSKKKNI